MFHQYIKQYTTKPMNVNNYKISQCVIAVYQSRNPAAGLSSQSWSTLKLLRNCVPPFYIYTSFAQDNNEQLKANEQDSTEFG